MDETPFQSEGDKDDARKASSHLTDSVKPPEVVGYRFLEHLGQGSFGQVWTAEQVSTGQMVAVKMLAEGVDAINLSRELQRLRLVSEHPNIVTLLDADLRATNPYLVMPLLAKGSLVEFCGANRANRATILTWFRQMAEALHFTHRQGLLHCDLKPSNVLLDAEGRVRVADFGQASVLTSEDSRFGTLGYMPPEQATEEPASPSVAWDIYALAATVYCLFTGNPPRWSEALATDLAKTTGLRQRLDLYRTKLRTLPFTPLVNDPELSALLESCLSLESDKRPGSMSEILEDLERLETDQPLLCRRPWTTRYRVAKALQRPLVRLGTLALVVILVGGTWFTWILSQRNRELTETLLESRFQAGRMALEAQDYHAALLLWAHTLELAPDDLALRTSISKPPVRLSKMIPKVSDFYSDPSGGKLALIGGRTVQVWDSGLKEPVSEPLDHEIEVEYAIFEPKTDNLVSVSARYAPTANSRPRNLLHYWNYSKNQKLGSFEDDSTFGILDSIAFTPKGLGTVTNNITLWDLGSRKPLARSGFTSNRILEAALSPDGEIVAHSDKEGELTVSSVNGGEVLAELERPDLGWPLFASNYLLWDDGTVWERESWKPLQKLERHFDSTWWDIILSPDRDHLAFSEKWRPILSTEPFQGCLTVYSLNQSPPKVVGKLRGGHKRYVHSFDVSPDGKFLLTGSDDSTARVWELKDGKPVSAPLRHRAPVRRVMWLDDHRLLTAADAGRVWEFIGRPKPVMDLDEVIGMSSILEDEYLALVRSDNIEVWSLAQKRAVASLPRRHPGGNRVAASVEFVPGGEVVFTEEGLLRVWDWRGDGKLREFELGSSTSSTGSFPLKPTSIHMHGDGTMLLFSYSALGQFWSWKSWEPLSQPREMNDGPLFATVPGFDSTGESLLAFGGDMSDGRNKLVYYSTREMEPLAEMELAEAGTSLSVSENGKWAVSGRRNGKIAIVDVAERTVREVGDDGSHQAVSVVRLSGDGQYFAAGFPDGSARLFSTSTGKELVKVGMSGPVVTLAFHPSNKMWATASANGLIQLWDFDGHQVGQARDQESSQTHELLFTPSGEQLVSRSRDQTTTRLAVWTTAQDDSLPVSTVRQQAELWTGCRLTSAGEIEPFPVEVWQGLRGR